MFILHFVFFCCCLSCLVLVFVAFCSKRYRKWREMWATELASTFSIDFNILHRKPQIWDHMFNEVMHNTSWLILRLRNAVRPFLDLTKVGWNWWRDSSWQNYIHFMVHQQWPTILKLNTIIPKRNYLRYRSVRYEKYRPQCEYPFFKRNFNWIAIWISFQCCAQFAAIIQMRLRIRLLAIANGTPVFFCKNWVRQQERSDPWNARAPSPAFVARTVIPELYPCKAHIM